MPTEQQVLEAFDAKGGRALHPGELKAELLERGFRPDDVAQAIDAAIESGKLVKTSLGNLRKG